MVQVLEDICPLGDQTRLSHKHPIDILAFWGRLSWGKVSYSHAGLHASASCVTVGLVFVPLSAHWVLFIAQ